MINYIVQDYKCCYQLNKLELQVKLRNTLRIRKFRWREIVQKLMFDIRVEAIAIVELESKRGIERERHGTETHTEKGEPGKTPCELPSKTQNNYYFY